MIVQGDARRIPLADCTVQCVVTSPPYWGLRKYAGAQDLIWDNLGGNSECVVRIEDVKPGWKVGDPPNPIRGHEWESNGHTPDHPDRGTVGKDANGSGVFGTARTQASKVERGAPAPLGDTCILCGAWRGGFGLEPTIEMYIAHTVEILREIRRVLRPDGVVFWNVGDSYGGSWGAQGRKGNGKSSYNSKISATQIDEMPRYTDNTGTIRDEGIKPKDLCLIPARVALAAQADGWWVRSLIIWAKPNPMPESCQDRPTDAYEHIIMLTKSEHYYWDADAVREPATSGELRATFQGNGAYTNNQSFDNSKIVACDDAGMEKTTVTDRNLRNVWTFPTQPYKGAHFATFPEEIPRRCILAATSERGACASCATPYVRVTEKKTSFESGSGKAGNEPAGKYENGDQMRAGDHDIRMGPVNEIKTLGWKPVCRCFDGSVITPEPCLVLDPFGGSGTTARVAVELNRRAISLDLAYHDHAEKRTRNVQRRLVSI